MGQSHAVFFFFFVPVELCLRGTGVRYIGRLARTCAQPNRPISLHHSPTPHLSRLSLSLSSHVLSKNPLFI